MFTNDNLTNGSFTINGFANQTFKMLPTTGSLIHHSWTKDNSTTANKSPPCPSPPHPQQKALTIGTVIAGAIIAAIVAESVAHLRQLERGQLALHIESGREAREWLDDVLGRAREHGGYLGRAGALGRQHLEHQVSEGDIRLDGDRVFEVVIGRAVVVVRHLAWLSNTSICVLFILTPSKITYFM